MTLWKVFLLGFLFSLALVASLVWVLVAYEAKTWAVWSEDHRLSQDVLFQVIRNAVTAGAALGVGITLFFSYRRQQTAEKTQLISAEAQRTSAAAQETAAEALKLGTRQHELDQARREDTVVSELRSRYSSAAEQLGSDKTPVQVAGIYAMATLADDWAAKSNRKDRQACIETLMGFYRILDTQAASSGPFAQDSATTRLAVWQNISDRFQKGSDNPWNDSKIDLSGLKSALPSLDNLDINARINFQNSELEDPDWEIRNTDFTTGELNLSGLVVNSLWFNSCSLLGGDLLISSIHAKVKIVFKDCTFSGTDIKAGFWMRVPNLEFINCTFNHPLGDYSKYGQISKIKFVDCAINVKIFIERTDGGSNPYQARIVRGCTYGLGIPELPSITPDPEAIRRHNRMIAEHEAMIADTEANGPT